MNTISYDGYNQSTHDEVSMPLRAANSGSEGNDAAVKVAIGFNAEPGNHDQQYHNECANTLACKHKEGVCQSIGFMPGSSAKTGSIGARDEQSPTLDTSSQKAVAIGFKAGQSANGGLGEENEVAPTLNHQPSALEPTVASFVRVGSMTRRERPTPPSEEVAQPLSASDGNIGDNAPVVIERLLAAMRYIVRRLTPTECECLQGIPVGYTIPVGLLRYASTSPDGRTLFDPSIVAEFQRIFDAYGAIMAEYAHKKPPKPKSAKQVAAWLAKISDPATCPDSPRYKALGNGWAVNQPRWILTRLLALDGINPFCPVREDSSSRPTTTTRG